jgi:hypothetical protein
MKRPNNLATPALTPGRSQRQHDGRIYSNAPHRLCELASRQARSVAKLLGAPCSFGFRSGFRGLPHRRRVAFTCHLGNPASGTKIGRLLAGPIWERDMRPAVLSKPRCALAVALLVPAGCATPAQHQVGYTGATIRQAVADGRACAASVYAKYPSLYTPDLSTGELPMAQMTDDTRPTPDEARLLAARRNDILPCRKRALDKIATARSDITSILARSWASDDQITALLIERKVTWAGAAREEQKVTAETRARLLAADREWTARMNAEK